MKTITHITIAAIISIFLFTSCEEVIEIDLNSSNPVINAQALIEEGTTASVRLMYSTDYFDGGDPEYIENSTVVIEDGSGNTETLEYSGEGYYESNLITGELNTRYTISFTTDEGQYTASSELKTPVTIQNISFEESLNSPPGSTGNQYTIIMDFTNDESQSNYYLIRFFTDGSEGDSQYILLEADMISQNGMIHMEPPAIFTFEEGAQMDIYFYSFDEQTFIYYNQLNDISGEGFRSSASPYNPASNFGPDVMGFFEARSFAHWSGIVE